MSTQINQQGIVIIGHLGLPQGECGWLQAHLFLESFEKVTEQDYLLVKRNGVWQMHALLGAQAEQEQLLLRLAGCGSLAKAKTYFNCEIALYFYKPLELPMEEYQRQELVGEGNRNYAEVLPRKEPRHTFTNALGNEYSPSAHPILFEAAQFSGDDQLNSNLPSESEEGRKEYQNQLQHQQQLQNEQKLQQTLSTPKLSR